MEFDWTNDLSVGVAGLDDQHLGIVCRADDLLHGAEDGHDGAEMARLVDLPAHYLAAHIAVEERRTGQDELPLCPAGEDGALALQDSLRGASAALCDGSRAIDRVLDTHQHVCEWLREHVEGMKADRSDHPLVELRLPA